MFTVAHRIRFDDVDGAGIVYYPHFFHLCHATMEDFIDAEGPVSYPELICEQRLGFPTVAIESTFAAPLAYGDTAVVDLSVDDVGTSSIRFHFEIRRERDGKLCFEGRVTTVFTDLNAQASVPLPDAWRSMLVRHKRVS